MTQVNDVMGKLPFPPGQLKPKHIRQEEYIDSIYPPASPALSDLTRFIVSTDKMFVGTYQLGPGGSFNPPDLHPGDETYYILNGTLTFGSNPPTASLPIDIAGRSMPLFTSPVRADEPPQ